MKEYGIEFCLIAAIWVALAANGLRLMLAVF